MSTVRELRFIAIAAMAENRAIGSGNKLPWHLPEDFRWFRQQTTGKTLLMGRKTFESIGRPLPNRTTLILSRSLSAAPAGTTLIRSLDELPNATQDDAIWICGGSEIYTQTLPFWSEVFLTRVKRTVEGDAFFPVFENRFPEPKLVADTADFSILHFSR